MDSENTALEQLERLVFANALPALPALSDPEYEELLDARDASEFSTPWTVAYELVSRTYTESEATQAVKNRIDNIRAHVYKRVYTSTEVSDLASYISDDFDLISRALVTGTENGWVNALWLSYKKGAVPSGQLSHVPGNLTGLIHL